MIPYSRNLFLYLTNAPERPVNVEVTFVVAKKEGKYREVFTATYTKEEACHGVTWACLDPSVGFKRGTDLVVHLKIKVSPGNHRNNFIVTAFRHSTHSFFHRTVNVKSHRTWFIPQVPYYDSRFQVFNSEFRRSLKAVHCVLSGLNSQWLPTFQSKSNDGILGMKKNWKQLRVTWDRVLPVARTHFL